MEMWMIQFLFPGSWRIIVDCLATRIPVKASSSLCWLINFLHPVCRIVIQPNVQKVGHTKKDDSQEVVVVGNGCNADCSDTPKPISDQFFPHAITPPKSRLYSLPGQRIRLITCLQVNQQGKRLVNNIPPTLKIQSPLAQPQVNWIPDEDSFWEAQRGFSVLDESPLISLLFLEPGFIHGYIPSRALLEQ